MLPTIDMSAVITGDDTFTHAVSAQIARACHDIGFVVVTGHGIPPGLIRELRQLTESFFEQPPVEKRKLQVTQDNYRGYIPLNFFTPNAAGRSPDGYEGYKLHTQIDADDPVRRACSLYGPNRWPDSPPALRSAIQSYWRHCDDVADALLSVLLQQLDIDTTFLRHAFDRPLTNMTLLHYPASSSEQEVSGIHPHKDTDVLTILAPDASGGLEIRPRGSDCWIRAEAPADGLVINIGDMLETWSGGYYVSTPHRVCHSGENDRYSFPYFSVPRFDVVIEPLRVPEAGFECTPVTAGEISRKIWQSNWPDASPIESCYDPAVVQNESPKTL